MAVEPASDLLTVREAAAFLKVRQDLDGRGAPLEVLYYPIGINQVAHSSTGGRVLCWRLRRFSVRKVSMSTSR